MKPIYLGTAVAAAIVGAVAIAQTDSKPAAKPATTAAAVKAISAEQFALKMAASDKFEVEASKAISTTATGENTKNFARMMINDHTKSTEKLIEIAKSVNPPITLRAESDTMQRKMLDEIRTATGGGVDKVYLDSQIMAHSATLATLKAYAANGTEPKLVAFAKDLIPTVSEHLEMAKKLRAQA